MHNPARRPAPSSRGPAATGRTFPVVGIGASAGGLAATLSNAASWLHRHRVTRRDLDLFWASLNRLRWVRANPLWVPFNAARESTLMLYFLLQMFYLGGVTQDAWRGLSVT